MISGISEINVYILLWKSEFTIYFQSSISQISKNFSAKIGNKDSQFKIGSIKQWIQDMNFCVNYLLLYASHYHVLLHLCFTEQFSEN